MTDRDKRRREGLHRSAVGVNNVKTHRIFEDVSTRDNPHFLCAYMQFPQFALWYLVVVFSRS